MANEQGKWGEWYDTTEGPCRELSSADGLIIDLASADAAYLNALEAEARAARLAADLATNALIALPCVSVSDTPCWERTDGYEGCTRCEALSALPELSQGGQQ